MKYLRSFCTLLCFTLFGVGAIVLNFLLFPFIKHNKMLCSKIIHLLWKFLLNIFIMFKLIKIDIKHLTKIQNRVIVATHPSFIDIVILIGLIPNTTCFVKKELAQNPILKNIINSIFITNDLEIDELREQTKNVLDLGFNIVIFPAGIRHRKNEYPKIKKGASLVALNSDKNVVPIKLFNDGDFLFINQPFYAANDHTITFTIDECQEIDINNFKCDNDIIAKKGLSKAIENSLYGH